RRKHERTRRCRHGRRAAPARAGDRRVARRLPAGAGRVRRRRRAAARGIEVRPPRTGILPRGVAVLSAAIITYNRARFLGDAIESVLGQTVGDVELIVVDDGSEDGTAAAVAPYLDRIRYVRRPHRGRAVARNTAVELAEGELIAFCDSDDRWYPDRLERQLDA